MASNTDNKAADSRIPSEEMRGIDQRLNSGEINETERKATEADSKLDQIDPATRPVCSDFKSRLDLSGVSTSYTPSNPKPIDDPTVEKATHSQSPQSLEEKVKDRDAQEKSDKKLLRKGAKEFLKEARKSFSEKKDSKKSGYDWEKFTVDDVAMGLQGIGCVVEKAPGWFSNLEYHIPETGKMYTGKNISILADPVGRYVIVNNTKGTRTPEPIVGDVSTPAAEPTRIVKYGKLRRVGQMSLAGAKSVGKYVRLPLIGIGALAGGAFVAFHYYPSCDSCGSTIISGTTDTGNKEQANASLYAAPSFDAGNQSVNLETAVETSKRELSFYNIIQNNRNDTTILMSVVASYVREHVGGKEAVIPAVLPGEKESSCDYAVGNLFQNMTSLERRTIDEKVKADFIKATRNVLCAELGKNDAYLVLTADN